ncbi:unnamed protein product, partial [Amoebophrya sp. A25]|eukprot:GSA25T00026155001.1
MSAGEVSGDEGLLGASADEDVPPAGRLSSGSSSAEEDKEAGLGVLESETATAEEAQGAQPQQEYWAEGFAVQTSAKILNYVASQSRFYARYDTYKF